jgi:GntR family transcriptional regulator
MELIIRNNSGQPIYDQISGQIKAQILSGALSPGDALPSIRGLAKDLKISVITTKRAYDELEAQGLINTVAGKGCFVAEPDLALFREQPYPTEEQVKEYLAGNLCRCSGYEGQLRGIMSFLAWKKQKEGVQ